MSMERRVRRGRRRNRLVLLGAACLPGLACAGGGHSHSGSHSHSHSRDDDDGDDYSTVAATSTAVAPREPSEAFEGGRAPSSMLAGRRFGGEIKLPADAPEYDDARWFETDYEREFGIDFDAMPDSWSWDNVGGVSYLTKMLNQNDPQCVPSAAARFCLPRASFAPPTPRALPSAGSIPSNRVRPSPAP